MNLLQGLNIQMQSFLAAAFSITSCYLWITKGIVPQDLLLINGIVVAFYFGNKARTDLENPVLPKPFIPGNERP